MSGAFSDSLPLNVRLSQPRGERPVGATTGKEERAGQGRDGGRGAGAAIARPQNERTGVRPLVLSKGLRAGGAVAHGRAADDDASDHPAVATSAGTRCAIQAFQTGSSR